MAAEYTENAKARTDEEWIRCKGNCFQTVAGQSRRCEAYGHHEWCCNYMVNQGSPAPEFFEACGK